VTLGKRIVQELGLDNSVDTLGRWMAHRVAELIERAEHTQAETDKEAAKNECTDLILKLWERRYNWPHGQPLAEIAEFLEKFASESVSPYQAKDNPD
jgi:chorismate-pyruvate lyase